MSELPLGVSNHRGAHFQSPAVTTLESPKPLHDLVNAQEELLTKEKHQVTSMTSERSSFRKRNNSTIDVVQPQKPLHHLNNVVKQVRGLKSTVERFEEAQQD
jgi:hypothetical protein